MGDPLPPETVEKLIEKVPSRYRALIVLGAGTGARISKAFGLTNDPGRLDPADGNSRPPACRRARGTMWRERADPLGIPLGDGFHQLRHFYASVNIRACASVKVVQERLGHTSAQITLYIYSHLWPEDDDTTRATVDSVLAPTARGERVG